MDSRRRWFRMPYGDSGTQVVRGEIMNEQVDKFWLSSYPDGFKVQGGSRFKGSDPLNLP